MTKNASNGQEVKQKNWAEQSEPEMVPVPENRAEEKKAPEQPTLQELQQAQAAMNALGSWMMQAVMPVSATAWQTQFNQAAVVVGKAVAHAAATNC